MADRWTVFYSAVQHSLNGWPALHIAQQQGFGGEKFREKLEWLLEVIVQIFQDNDTVYPDELEEYVSECLYNEFDIIVEDGTCPKVIEKICNFNKHCQMGQFDKVLDELRVPPVNCPPVTKAACNEEGSDDECQNGEQSSQMSNDKINPMSNKCEHDPIINSRETCEESSQMQSSTMDVDESIEMEDEDNDGWEVVKRTKKKSNSRKS